MQIFRYFMIDLYCYDFDSGPPTPRLVMDSRIPLVHLLHMTVTKDTLLYVVPLMMKSDMQEIAVLTIFVKSF